MQLEDFYIEPATWPVDRDDIEPIRLEVFVKEQKVPEDEEFDDDDPLSQHFLARALDGAVIGTARLTRDGRIGRIAVDRQWRKRGVGRSLLRSALEAAKLRGLEEVRLTAQTYAEDFYTKLGFRPEGDVFDDVGIPHRWMRLKLEDREFVAPREPRHREPAAPEEIAEGAFWLASEYAERMLALIRCCHGRLDLFTRNLEPSILNRAEIVEALTELLSFATDPRVRVLVIDSKVAVQDTHRWIGLSQRRSSALGIRKPASRHRHFPGAFAVADGRHYIYREFADRWEGRAHINDAHEARKLEEMFEDAWEHGSRDPDIQRLDL